MSIGEPNLSRDFYCSGAAILDLGTVCTLWGWRHLVNNLHTVAKMAAAILRHCSKNLEKDSTLVPPILVKTTHKET